MALIAKRRARRRACRHERQRRAMAGQIFATSLRVNEWDDPEGPDRWDEGGGDGAGVREPRRPRPSQPSGSIALDLPVH